MQNFANSAWKDRISVYTGLRKNHAATRDILPADDSNAFECAKCARILSSSATDHKLGILYKSNTLNSMVDTRISHRPPIEHSMTTKVSS